MINAVKSQQMRENVLELFEHLPLDDEFRQRLFTSSEPRGESVQERAYAHYMRRAFEDAELQVDAIFCVAGRPTVYFKQVERFDVEYETKAQEALWNQGMATLLVITDPSHVRIYSSFVAPDPDSQENQSESLENRRIEEALSRAEFGLQVRDWMLRVETGQIYRANPEKFKSSGTVDRKLLENLSAAADVLCQENQLKREMAHSLLGRVLFVCYLCDREIITRDYFVEAGANASDLRELLGSSEDWLQRRKQLYDLFAKLQKDFNGSLLNENLNEECLKINEKHLQTLSALLSGHQIKTGQQSLFPFYKFKWIPIETISAIYESFISAEDSADNSTSQSESGAFYTPRHLAEMTVDAATRDWETLLDKRCLDPACGSGIFLVVLFNRMAEEWRARHPEQDNVERALKLRELMLRNLCGVDLKRTACRITCFSLYLAFFDKLTPPDIRKLSEELAKTKRKVLPALLASEENPQVENVEQPVIFTADFFECGSSLFGPRFDGQFHLVIGNPPWIGREQTSSADNSAWNWLKSSANPNFEQVPPKTRLRTFFPQKLSAIAFMWKVPLHLNAEGRGCLVLPSKVLLGDTDEFQQKWLTSFAVERVLQLADYSFLLFENASSPTSVISFLPHPPKIETHTIVYDTPKVERLDPRHAVIPVLPEEQKLVQLTDILRAAERDEAALIWKTRLWGTPRDMRALERLRRFPPLSVLAGAPRENKRWVKGQGFQAVGSENLKPRWWEDNQLFIDTKSKKIDLLLLPSDCVEIGDKPKTVHRPRNLALFQPPLVLINKGFSKFAFCDFSVLFRHALQSISGPNEDENLLMLLTGVLSSPVASYFLFHTSGNWGTERDSVHMDELLRLPFPLPEQTANPTRAREIVGRVVACIRQARAVAQQAAVEAREQALVTADRAGAIEAAKLEINELVFDYYGLSSNERALVEDTMKVYIPSSTPTSANAKIVTLDKTDREQRSIYAQQLCDALNGWSRNPNLHIGANVLTAPKIGLALLTLTKVAKSAEYTERDAPNEVSDVMGRVQNLLRQEGEALSYISDFAFFEEDAAYIIKPLNLRHWTRSAALNDADAMFASMGG